MVLDYKLTYPSGTATAMLINSFHADTGAELAGYLLDALCSLSFHRSTSISIDLEHN